RTRGRQGEPLPAADGGGRAPALSRRRCARPYRRGRGRGDQGLRDARRDHGQARPVNRVCEDAGRGLRLHTGQKTRRLGALYFLRRFGKLATRRGRRPYCAGAIALMRALRRESWRAAVFLCSTPLLTLLWMSGWAALNASIALARSPVAIACSILPSAVLRR